MSISYVSGIFALPPSFVQDMEKHWSASATADRLTFLHNT